MYIEETNSNYFNKVLYNMIILRMDNPTISDINNRRVFISIWTTRSLCKLYEEFIDLKYYQNYIHCLKGYLYSLDFDNFLRICKNNIPKELLDDYQQLQESRLPYITNNRINWSFIDWKNPPNKAHNIKHKYAKSK